VIPIPISDENPAVRKPYVTTALIIINALAWLYEFFVHGVGLSTFDYGAIPAWLLHGIRDGWVMTESGRQLLHQEVPWPLTVVTSMFMHGSWLHIIGNMWFLWIFGDNVEDAMGHVRYAVFYFVCGVAAAAAQVLAAPGSLIPMVGASGAIAGVLGAYLLLYPRARVKCLWFVIIFFMFIYVPAWLLLGLWFVSQFFVGGSEVAWMAHVGGFITGFALVRLFVPRRPPPRRTQFPPLFQRV
jgi:membrane associated rhomboid family serine protease